MTHKAPGPPCDLAASLLSARACVLDAPPATAATLLRRSALLPWRMTWSAAGRARAAALSAWRSLRPPWASAASRGSLPRLACPCCFPCHRSRLAGSGRPPGPLASARGRSRYSPAASARVVTRRSEWTGRRPKPRCAGGALKRAVPPAEQSVSRAWRGSHRVRARDSRDASQAHRHGISVDRKRAQRLPPVLRRANDERVSQATTGGIRSTRSIRCIGAS